LIIEHGLAPRIRTGFHVREKDDKLEDEEQLDDVGGWM